MQLTIRRPLGTHPLLLVGLVVSLLALAACQPIRDPAVIAAEATAAASGAAAPAEEAPLGVPPAMATISASSLRVRALPTDDSEVVAGVKQGESYKVIGISADGAWIQIEIDKSPTGTGWVSASFVTLEGDITNIATVDAAEATEEPVAEATAEATEEPTAEATEEPAAEATAEATEEPAAEATPEATEEPVAEATPEATEEPAAEATPEATEEPAAEATPEATEEAMAEATDDIVGMLASDESFSILVSALQAAGLADDLAAGGSAGEVTIFAPTNAAFEALGQEAVDALLADPTGALAQVLLYHVVPGQVLTKDLSDGLELATLHGATVRFAVLDTGTMINGANIVIADVPATNGVIHVIDALILPPDEAPAAEATPAATEEPAAEATPAPTEEPAGDLGTVTINSDLPLRVRSEPTAEVDNKVGNVFDGETYTVLEVSADGAWVRIDVPQLGLENGGWVAAEYVVFN